ncbi:MULTISPECIES: group II truncated hemoglobin [Pseudoxanthomonas]|uniref:group II truncated hemoglobin n=1 Tax=Pseudoxanthomonas TaxID=83618 RepID=UPI00161D862D|nr:MULTISPECIES: group II truncated hemoglobin [Pseudoxanthomonas]MBB3274539.1 hemoglobin [Pseudoxanthomonas sp. OG2]MBD9378214.1 group II truncated hemoglobin [Pseudoxanthomonas sp. PXM04]MBV7475045.1 group II truncated hemoglobin [Pseudoxanthomonas sp. PXM05]UBB27131.1 group II truncated hemoglobin [Pseudoxanthomonas japonensis]
MQDDLTPYQRIGGEAGVRKLTRRMYALMDALPEAAAVRAIHPPELADSEQKLFEFLSGWLGGPPLFTERRGAPMLRARHLPFAIGMDEASGWLACFHQAMEETVADADLREFLWSRIEPLALHMRNQQALPAGWTGA